MDKNLPVRIWGVDSNGKPFNLSVVTADLSGKGARLEKVSCALLEGDVIGVQFGEAKARFRVQWSGRQGTRSAGQVGIRCLDADQAPWGAAMPGPASDTYDPNAVKTPIPPRLPAQVVAAPPAPVRTPAAHVENELTKHLEKAREELQRIEAMMRDSAVDARVLSDFREAADRIRQSSAAVQQWLDLDVRHQDGFSVVQMLTQERVRTATRLCKEVIVDVQGGDVGWHSGGLDELRNALAELSFYLDRFANAAGESAPAATVKAWG